MAVFTVGQLRSWPLTPFISFTFCSKTKLNLFVIIRNFYGKTFQIKFKHFCRPSTWVSKALFWLNIHSRLNYKAIHLSFVCIQFKEPKFCIYYFPALIEFTRTFKRFNYIYICKYIRISFFLIINQNYFFSIYIFLSYTYIFFQIRTLLILTTSFISWWRVFALLQFVFNLSNTKR